MFLVREHLREQTSSQQEVLEYRYDLHSLGEVVQHLQTRLNSREYIFRGIYESYTYQRIRKANHVHGRSLVRVDAS